MYYEVYLDQFFLENLVMTVFLQKICGKLMNRSLSWKRIWLASLTGTAASCAVIFFRPFSGWPARALCRLLPAVLTAGLGCRPGSVRDVCRCTLYLLAAGAFFAGIFQLVFLVWEPPALLAGAAAYTVADRLIARQRERMVLGEYRTRITLADQGDRCVLTGLIDTGNHLTEPMTGRPVSIVDWQEAEKLERFRHILREKNGYLLIPYRAVGTEKGWMMGMVIDAMYVRYKGKEIRIVHPVLAVSREKLSRDGRYQIILNPLHIAAG